MAELQIGFPKNKQTKKSVQCSEGASMTIQWTRGGGNQEKKDQRIDRFN